MKGFQAMTSFANERETKATTLLCELSQKQKVIPGYNGCEKRSKPVIMMETSRKGWRNDGTMVED